MQHDFILLDRSGSMSSLWQEALSSVNSYVAKLATDQVDTNVTLATFDTMDGSFAFDIVRHNIAPRTWRRVTNEDILPRGFTPLNDAIGRIVAQANLKPYDKVAIIIMTDGQENASREYTVDRAKKLLDDCRAKGWQVVFLGADFDNAVQAASYNTMATNTVQSSATNLRKTMTTMAAKRATYGATGQSMDWTEQEKEQAKKQ